MDNLISIKVIVFVIITFIFTAMLATLQQYLKIDYKYITLPQWGPGIAAIMLGLIFYKNTIDKCFRFSEIKFVKLIICLLLPIALMAAGYYISKTLSFTSGSIEKVNLQFICLFVPLCFLGAIGEELGWRGFLQTSLDGRFNYLIASILVGVFWGLWHIGHYKNGLVFIVFFLIFTISASIIIVFLIRESHYNLWLAAIFHFSINIGFFVFYRNNLNDTKMIIVNGLVWLTGAVITLVPTLRDFILKS